MKILFLCEYFYPFAHGGSEWSTYYLAQSFIKKGHPVSILTPNYGTINREKWRKISIFRLPFPVKLSKNKPKAVTPFWFTNILFDFISTLWTVKIIKKLKIDVIHVQGNYFIPAAYIAGKLLHKKVIVTVRDYQIICPYGFCLTANNNYQRCSFADYIKKDLKFYLQNYFKKPSFYKQILIFVSAVNGRIISYYLSILLKNIDKVVCISKKQGEIFRTNGFNHISIIHNSALINGSFKKKYRGHMLYAGRLTPGKGVEILIHSCLPILKTNPKLKLLIIGDGILRDKLRDIVIRNKTENKIIFLGQISHDQVLNYLSEASLTVVPSVWEEPFGRIALESLLLGIPTVVTDRGGLPEIIEDKKTGYVVKPTVKELRRGLSLALKNNNRLRRNIINEKYRLNLKFSENITKAYLNLYNTL